MRKIVIVLATILLIGIGGGGNMENNGLPLKGENVLTIRKTFQNDMILNLGPLFAFKNEDRIIVLITENSAVIGEAVFDENGQLLSSDGVVPLASDAFTTTNIETAQEMEDAFGNPHVDIGSGATIPTYIVDDGRVVTYHIYNNNIINQTIYLLIDETI